jgi:hypothetical protein
LIVADIEHFAVELLDFVRRQTTPYDLLVPLRQTPALQRHYQSSPPEAFIPHWAGFAIATEPFLPRRSTLAQPCARYIQRAGESPQSYHFKGFCSSRPRPEVPALTSDFPKRFNFKLDFRFK